jgi:hypothetical protein
VPETAFFVNPKIPLVRSAKLAYISTAIGAAWPESTVSEIGMILKMIWRSGNLFVTQVSGLLGTGAMPTIDWCGRDGLERMIERQNLFCKTEKQTTLDELGRSGVLYRQATSAEVAQYRSLLG